MLTLQSGRAVHLLCFVALITRAGFDSWYCLLNALIRINKGPHRNRKANAVAQFLNCHSAMKEKGKKVSGSSQKLPLNVCQPWHCCPPPLLLEGGKHRCLSERDLPVFGKLNVHIIFFTRTFYLPKKKESLLLFVRLFVESDTSAFYFFISYMLATQLLMYSIYSTKNVHRSLKWL